MPDDNIEYRVSGHGEADEDPGFPVSCLDSFILQQTDRQIADVVKLRVSEESGPDLDDGGSGSTSIQPSRESAKALIRDTGYYDTGAVGVSELYKFRYRKCFLHNKTTSQWEFYDKGPNWQIDQKGQYLAAIEGIVEWLLEEAFDIDKEIKELDPESPKIFRLKKTMKGCLKLARWLRTNKGRNECVFFAHTTYNGLGVLNEEFDTEPNEICFSHCEKNIYNLVSSLVRPGLPEDLKSQCIPHPLADWYGTPKRFLKFLYETMNGDPEMVLFLQRLLGMTLLRKNKDHIFIIFEGQGRNGKSLLIKILLFILGPMATVIPSEMLLDQGRFKNSSGPSPDLMMLYRVNLAIASETDPHQKISPARVKWLSSDDTVIARLPHDKMFTKFEPTHTLILSTNHIPNAPADDFAFWERCLRVRFEVSFVNREPQADNERRADKHLFEKMKDEAPEILAWLIRGCHLYQKQGLCPPLKVVEATAEFKRDSDMLADFLDDCCIINPDATAGAKELYEAFEEWFELNISKRVPKMKAFGSMMTKRFEKRRVSGVYRYYGIGLKLEI